LVHLNADGKGDVFKADSSSSMIRSDINSLVNDGSGGVWIGTTYNGLEHLTFGSKEELCKKDPKQCENLYGSRRGAIIIAGGGTQWDNQLWDTTERISNYLYKMLNKRGFDHPEIYYLTPKSEADFTGDGFPDNIVDATKPAMTADDVRAAFGWAKSLGKLDQPLYVFFTDHGGTDKLQLSKGNDITASDLKAALQDYISATGGEILMVIDACYSGAFLKQITGPGISVISSTGDGLAYFDKLEKQAFSYFLAKALLKGSDFFGAFGQAQSEQKNYLGTLKDVTTGGTSGNNITQSPQYDDGSSGQKLKQTCINGCFAAGDFTLSVQSLVTSPVAANAGQSVTLKAKAQTAAGYVKRAWAVIRPPKMNLAMSSSGTPLLAFPRISLSAAKDKDVWETTWSAAVYNGEYEITFYAEDNEQNISGSDESLKVNVSGGVNPPASASVRIDSVKNIYHGGDSLRAEIVENLGWGYDLYAVLIMPGGQIFMLTNKNEGSPLSNDIKKWLPQSWQLRPQNSAMTVLDLTLPKGIPAGQYCIGAILSPESQPVLDEKISQQWIWDKKCFDFE